MSSDPEEFHFEVDTPLGFSVRAGRSYWQLIVTIKHPVMADKERGVMHALEAPDEIRQSRSDPAVFLFYTIERPGRWICAVARRLNGDGFLVTAYPTDAIKEGVRVWPV